MLHEYVHAKLYESYLEERRREQRLAHMAAELRRARRAERPVAPTGPSLSARLRAFLGALRPAARSAAH